MIEEVRDEIEEAFSAEVKRATEEDLHTRTAHHDCGCVTQFVGNKRTGWQKCKGSGYWDGEHHWCKVRAPWFCADEVMSEDEKSFTVTIPSEGVRVTARTEPFRDEHSAEPGDFYIARRHNPWRLFTVDRIDDENGWVRPEDKDGLPQYPFDHHMCHLVLNIEFLED